MASRLDLQTQLEELLGSRNVYYQSPESIKLKYPCIIYHLSRIRTDDANNKKYLKHRLYQLTLIDEDPDSDLVDKVLELPMCSFDRSFSSDGLNHFVFNIYY